MGEFEMEGFQAGEVADATQRQHEGILWITPPSEYSEHPMGLIIESLKFKVKNIQTPIEFKLLATLAM